MKTVWHVTGENAGSFESVPDKKADELAASGAAQIAEDGFTPAYPEGHRHYAPIKKNRAKKKYPNKMMETEKE